MAAGVYNFKVEQGVAYSFTVTYQDKDNVVIPLTGYTANGKIKLKMSDPTHIAEFVCTVNEPEGKVTVLLPSDVLNSITFKANKFDDYVEAVYDILLTKSDEVPLPIRLLNGTIKISPKVT
jgi:hypothetical protein